MRLDFIAVGPQRTASSWLHLMLQQHPDVSLPIQVKETMFWDKNFEKGSEWYGRCFQSEISKSRFGEIAPTLFSSELARGRLREASNQTRIIVLLRDPVERAVSHYRHERALGLQRGSLREAVSRDPRILEGSRYSKYLPRWIDDFGRENVSLVSQKAIAEEPGTVLRQLCVFLGIDEQFDFQETAVKASGRSTARSVFLAGLLYRSASALRGRHWHGLVNFGKRLGIRRLLYSGKAETVSDADLAYLERALAGEREFIEGLACKSN